MYDCCIFWLFSYLPLLSLFFVCFLLNVFNIIKKKKKSNPPSPLSTSVEHFVCMCKHLYQVKNTNEVVEYLMNTMLLQDQNVGTKGEPDSRVAWKRVIHVCHWWWWVLLKNMLFMLATDGDVELNVLRHPMGSKHQLTNPKSSDVSWHTGDRSLPLSMLS